MNFWPLGGNLLRAALIGFIEAALNHNIKNKLDQTLEIEVDVKYLVFDSRIRTEK